MKARLILVLAVATALLSARAAAQDTAAVRVTGDSLTIRFVEADLRGVLQTLSRHLDRPLVMGTLPAVRVTIETPRPISRAGVLLLVRGIAESYNLEILADSAYYRVRQREPVAPVAAQTAAQTQAALELTVIRLRHARAADVASTLSALFGVGSEGSATGRPGTLSDELRRGRVPAQTPAGQAPPAGGTAGGTAARSAALEGSVTIVPDRVSNALLVRATRRDTELLQAAVQELDLRPLQVLIEVTIVEARRDQQTAWGLDLTHAPRPIGGGDGTVRVTQQGGGLGDFVLSIMNLGRADIDAVLRAGTSSGNVRILSRPVLLAANNQEARFMVGSQRPFVQVSRSLPTDAPSRDQVIQYKDVGTRLTVRPSISAEGYVTLDIVQEVSSATNETAFDAPVISTREASTQVLVRDSQTVVLGGLIDRQTEATSGGIPFLSEIPIIGGLFGRQSRRASETELFLFLTPRILRTDDDVDSATRRLQDQQRP